MDKGERLSVLEQDHYKYDDFTALDTVIMGNARLYEIMKEKDAIYLKEDFTEEDGIRASELEGEFAELNGWEAESDAAILLNGLGIDNELHTKYLREVRRRAKGQGASCPGALWQPGCAPLDEPTNHLDLTPSHGLRSSSSTLKIQSLLFPMTAIS